MLINFAREVMNVLKKIRISGYKSLREQTIDLQPINILIGGNGVGKSNFLSFFRMLNYITSKALQLYVARVGGANTLLYYGAKSSPQFECSLTFDTKAGSNVYEAKFACAAGDTLIFLDELVSFTRTNSSAKTPKSLGSAGHKETMLDDAKVPELAKTAQVIKSIMSMWRVYHFHDTSPDARVKKKCSIADNEYLRDDAGNLAPFLYRLRSEHPAYYGRIVEYVRLFAPWFGDFVLKPDVENTGTISLSWREKDSDYPFGVDQLSDGTLRMMALISMLLQPSLPSCIILDEPELGLHPFALRLLADIIKATSRKSQVVVATQSAYFVDQFTANDILVAERSNKQSVFKRLDESALELWLKEYSLGELWEMNVFGGRPAL